jgi:hypothetical protein
VTSDRSLNVEVELSSFRWPAMGAKSPTFPLGQVAARGTLKVVGPANLLLAFTAPADEAASRPAASTPPRAIALDSIDLAIDSPALANYLDVNGVVHAGGGAIHVDQRITHLISSAGQLALATAQPEGSIDLESIAGDTVALLAPPTQADVARELLRGHVSGKVSTNPRDNGLHAAVSLNSESLMLNTSVLRSDNGALTLDSTHAEVTVTPALAALMQKHTAQPVVLRQQAKVVADVEGFSLPAAHTEASLFATPLRGRVRVEDAVIERAPTLAEPLAVPSLEMALTVADAPAATGGNAPVPTLSIADGRASLRRTQAPRDIALLTFEGSFALAGDALTPNLEARLTDLNTPAAEALLGQQPGAVSHWTGESGSLEVRLESDEPHRMRAVISPAMPNLEGTFVATMRDGVVSLTAETARLVLAKDALQSRLNPPRKSSAQPDAVSQILVQNSVPVQLSMARCEFPWAMVQGEKFDASKVNVDVRLSGGPLKFDHPDGVKSSLNDLDMSVTVSDLSQGLRFVARGKAEAIAPARSSPPAAAASPPPRASGEPQTQPEARSAEERREARREERRESRAATRPTEAPAATTPSAATQPQRAGVIDITGSLAHLISGEGLLDLAGSRLQMTAKVSEAPTALADALADMQGLLVAAVGPTMNATFIADDFSANSGTLDAKIDTTNGHLESVVRGRENSLRINKNAPLKAQLDITPELRERLLMRIHPILADVRTTEQPLRAEIPTALAAIPADVSKLRAEMNITIGKVEFDAGSTTMQIFNLLGRGDTSVIPGEIEPIHAQIRNGIVTYEKFTVHISKYMLNYSGQIDLAKDTVDLRTEIPLGALKHDIKELRDYADSIVVPLVTRGKFGDLKTSIDPDFDLGKAALDAGFRGTLGELLRGEGGLLRDLFEKKEP